MKTAIVLTFDRLALRVLGCYGCVSAPTPHFDRFAAEAVVFDRHFAENVDPAAQQQAGWTGRFQFPLSPSRQQRERPRLLDLLQKAGGRTVLLQEKTARFAAGVADAFGERRTLGNLTELFAAAQNVLHTTQHRPASGKLLLWISAAGLPWDDNSSASVTEPDSEVAPGGALWRRYSTEFREVDRSFGRFREAVHSWWQQSGGELLLCVTAEKGQPLGEQQVVPADFRLPASLQPLSEGFVHTPLMVHEAGREMGTRRSSLVQPVDWMPTLLDWFGLSWPEEETDGLSLLPLVRDEEEAAGHAFAVTGAGQHAAGIRTADFYLMAEQEAVSAASLLSPEEEKPQRGSPAGTEGGVEERGLLPAGVRLFVKPDDLWEVHNVVEQEPEQAATLLAQLREFVRFHGK